MPNTLSEWPQFWGALYGGLVIGIVYDLFSLLRLPFGNKWCIAVIDALFYVVAGVLSALTMIFVNGGSPRIFIIAGLILGAYLYLHFVGRMLKFLTKKCKNALVKPGRLPDNIK